MSRRHRLVASLASDDLEAVKGALRALPPGVDLAEIRLDALWHEAPNATDATEHLLALTDAASACGIDLLATLRPTRQGGMYDGSEEVRIGLLAAACRAGFGAVDLENDLQEQAAVARHLRAEADRMIVSEHRLPTAPSREDGMRRLQAMQDLGGDHDKLAFAAGSFADALRALELAHGHAARQGSPAVIPMGYGDAAIRALLALAGNTLTYGHAASLPPAASGQPSVDDLLATWTHWGLGPEALGPPDVGARPWLAVLGDPVRHSLSPRIHNAALRAAVRPERYGALHVPDSIGAVRLLAMVATRIGLTGASVTAPLKGHAAQVAEGDASVQATGAANCLRFFEGGATATNTDAAAFTRLLEPHRDSGALLVLGAGGAARAALHAASTLGIPSTFTSRDAARAQSVQTDLGAKWVPWDQRSDVDASIIVQATPLGSAPDDPTPCILGPDVKQLIELVYAHGRTALQRQAEAADVPVVDGRMFLVEQAQDAYRFWFDAVPDRTAMDAALALDDPEGSA